MLLTIGEKMKKFIQKYFNTAYKLFQSQAMKNIFDSKCFVFAFSGVLGAIFFIHIYGIRVLNPMYTDWLMVGGDTTQHYLGFEFFRNSEWSFPIGLTEGIIYPYKESIMFSDSIPLFAIFFKTISFLLPDNFQYFGWFGILMYILQGGFGGLIIKKITNNTTISGIASLFFTMSSMMMLRMYNHTSLAAHFIILIAIYVCISKDKNKNIYHNIIIWGGLLSLAATIHMYFVPMVFIFMMLYFIDDIFEYRKWAKPVIELSASTALCLMTMFIIGAFYSGTSKSAGDGIRMFSTNINSIFNPNGESIFLKNLPISPGAEAGTAYIGYGMIIMIFIALFAFADNFKTYRKKISDKVVLRRVILGVIAFFIFYLLALGPNISLNDNLLIAYKLPKFIERIWNIFRATERFVWPSIYIIMVLAIYITAKKYRKITTVVIMSVLVLVQFQDVHDSFRSQGKYFRKQQTYETNLKSDMWNVIASDYKHLFLFSEPHENLSLYYALAKFAVNNGLTINDFYLARKPYKKINPLKEKTLENLNNGHADHDTVYLYKDVPEQLILDKTLFVYEFDGIIAGFTKEIKNAKQINGVVRIIPKK